MSAVDGAGARPLVAELSRITTLHPRTYNEARTIGENFRDGTPVIMNLTEMEDEDAKRLVDFRRWSGVRHARHHRADHREGLLVVAPQRHCCRGGQAADR